jgi:hypothetical protein
MDVKKCNINGMLVCLPKKLPKFTQKKYYVGLRERNMEKIKLRNLINEFGLSLVQIHLFFIFFFPLNQTRLNKI